MGHVAIYKVFGPLGVLQRCQVDERRNILDHLPERLHASVDRVLRETWDSPDVSLARRRPQGLASSLEAEHPGAAGSIREGLEKTLALQRLDIEGALYRTLHSTNTIENLNDGVATYARNVKRWRSGPALVASRICYETWVNERDSLRQPCVAQRSRRRRAIQPFVVTRHQDAPNSASDLAADLGYLERRSALTDLALILRTIWAILPMRRQGER